MSLATGTHTEAIRALCDAAGCTPETINHADLMLYRHCRQGRGSRVAIHFNGRAYTFDQIADAAARTTSWLLSCGITPGQCVIVSLPDCPMLASTYFGVVAAGATAVIIDPRLSLEDAFHIAQLSEARLIVAEQDSASGLTALQSLPGMMSLVRAGECWLEPSELAEEIAARNADRVVRQAPRGLACGLLTSGSTGRPKLIVHRHQDILHGFFGFACDVLELNSNDCGLCVAKMTTGYGLGCSLLMPFLAGARTALLTGPPAGETVASAVEASGCTLLFAQPRFLSDALSTEGSIEKLRSLRLVVTGGEPLADALLDRWSKFSRTELLDSYGSTEIGFLYISNRPGRKKRRSVGWPVRGLQIEIVDQGGNAVGPNEIGRLRVRGPMIIDGYWNESDRTAESFQDGWFTTSDLFSMDSDGCYFIHGRSDHLIKLGCGDWVNPIEVECALLEHPGVRECAVVGSPGEDGLTMLKALVALDSIETPSRAMALELSRIIRNRWPAEEHKQVSWFEFVQSLPKTTAGKLDRGKLRPQSMTEFSYRC
jgi:acyl-coenzyme A synthetase/AMP-(fatty) acid ligase